MTGVTRHDLFAMSIDTPYALASEQVAFFRSQGFVKLKQVLTPEEIVRFGPEITRLTIALNDETKPLEERSTYDKAFLQVPNLWEQSEVVRQFVFGKRLARIAAELLEVSGVRLYHDQALYKEPGGGFTPAHADQFYWPLATDRTVTAWIPLQPVPVEMGPLAFYAGSRTVEVGRDFAISDVSEAEIAAHMKQRGLELVDGPFELGEVSFHNGWTFHRAGPNNTADPRAVMTIIYMDSEMRLKQPANYAQRKDGEDWCPGAVVGEVIRTPKNPLLYSHSP
jgi:ectoine hydroxylase-related dioxygenase (phytanoyl-CoA dioxygenase family)